VDVATATKRATEGHQACRLLEFWPDGRRLASSSADQTILIWDVANRKGLDVMRGHRLEAWRVVLHPDNDILISGSKDGAVCVWDTSVTHSRRESTIWPEKISNWRFAPDSRSVVTLATEGSVTRWSGGFSEKTVVGPEPITAGQLFPGWSLSAKHLSADGRFLHWLHQREHFGLGRFAAGSQAGIQTR
jgi:WD40 repeat protein